MASWAPSIASRKEADGKTHFYLYYSNSGSGVGMLTATSPVGPWTDPLGKCVVDGNTPGLGKCKAPFDPGVVIDDKGIGWLSFGGGDSDDYIPGDARIVRLANDMKTLDSEISERHLDLHLQHQLEEPGCMAPQGYRQAEPVLHELHDESHAT